MVQRAFKIRITNVNISILCECMSIESVYVCECEPEWMVFVYSFFCFSDEEHLNQNLREKSTQSLCTMFSHLALYHGICSFRMLSMCFCVHGNVYKFLAMILYIIYIVCIRMHVYLAVINFMVIRVNEKHTCIVHKHPYTSAFWYRYCSTAIFWAIHDKHKMCKDFCFSKIYTRANGNGEGVKWRQIKNNVYMIHRW